MRVKSKKELEHKTKKKKYYLSKRIQEFILFFSDVFWARDIMFKPTESFPMHNF